MGVAGSPRHHYSLVKEQPKGRGAGSANRLASTLRLLDKCFIFFRNEQIELPQKTSNFLEKKSNFGTDFH